MSVTFFSSQNYTGHLDHFFSLFYLSYLSLEMWEISLKVANVKQDRKAMNFINDEIFRAFEK